MTEKLSRRTLLKRGTGGVTVLVLGGLVWRAWDNGVFSIGEGPAYEPWRNWQNDEGDALMGIVRAGILAANAHNTQPWRFVIRDQQIEVFADTARNLGAFDPYLREMHVSLGCALENMRLAALAAGLVPDISLPACTLLEGRVQPSGGPAAILDLTPGEASVDPLYSQIPHRHTSRGHYVADQTLSADQRTELLSSAAAFDDVEILLVENAPERKALGDLIVSSTEQIITDHTMSHDSGRWFRFTWDAVRDHRDGVSLDTVGMPSMLNAAAKIIPAPSLESSDQQWLGSTRDIHVGTAPVLGIIAVRDLYDRPNALRAGQVWQRMHLLATELGIAMQPLNQPVEMVDRERQLGKPDAMAQALAAFTGPDWKSTFSFRVGIAERPARLSPRRAIEDVVTRGT